MYETVKTINGYNIERMKGTKGYYTVTVKVFNDSKKYYSFRTIKSASDFCETLK